MSTTPSKYDIIADLEQEYAKNDEMYKMYSEEAEKLKMTSYEKYLAKDSIAMIYMRSRFLVSMDMAVLKNTRTHSNILREKLTALQNMNQRAGRADDPHKCEALWQEYQRIQALIPAAQARETELAFRIAGISLALFIGVLVYMLRSIPQ
jgi:hypothetical protein